MQARVVVWELRGEEVELRGAKGWEYPRNEQSELGVREVRHPVLYNFKSALELDRVHMARFGTVLGILCVSKAGVTLNRFIGSPPESVCVRERVILPGVRRCGGVPRVEVVRGERYFGCLMCF